MRITQIVLLTLIVVSSGSAVARDSIEDATARGIMSRDSDKSANVAVSTQTNDGPKYRSNRKTRPLRDYYLPNYPHRISVCTGGRGGTGRC